MSRSNPNEIIKNPSTRWWEWNGERGGPRYYDKELQKNVEVDLPFEFILLDRLSTITGWHKRSEANIFANEIRDSRKETLLVESFKLAEAIAEGFYADIKDKVNANGGKFTINAYIGYTDDAGKLALGSFKMHGAAMSAFIEFENNKSNRPFLYKKGIRIASTKHGENGSEKKKIEWEAPVFELVDVPRETNDAATKLDLELQIYLRSYFKRTRVEQVEPDERPSIEDEDADANREMAEAGTNGNPADYIDGAPF